MSISGISKYTEWDDYTHEKGEFVDKKVANLKNSIDIIKSGGEKRFPNTINAIAIYEAGKDKPPKKITVLKEYIKDDDGLLKQLNTEIEKHHKYFEEIADFYWRDHVVLKIIESTHYNPNKAGENARFVKRLLSKFAEYLEDKYIKDIDFVNTSLEWGLFIKRNSDALGDELKDAWYKSMDDLTESESFKKRGKKLKGDLPGILEEREGVEIALLASKFSEASLNSSSNSNNTSNVEAKGRRVTAKTKPVTKGVEAPKVKNAATAKVTRATAAAAKPAEATAKVTRATATAAKASAEKPHRGAENESNYIFRGLTDAYIRNLRSIESLNAFIRERFVGIPAGDKLKKKSGNVFTFMGYEGLAEGNPLQTLTQMHQNETSGEGSDCLVHTFLTITCAAFRKLPNELKDPVARSFRHDLYPRFAEVAAVLAAEGGAKSVHRYNRATQPNLYRIFKVGEFLNDSDIGWLSDIYHINMLIFQSPASADGVRQPAMITLIEKDDRGVVYTFSNHGNFHFESVQNTETNSFTISHVVANQIKAEGQKQLPPEAKVTGCRFNTGDPIIWNGNERFVISRRSEGGERCIEYFIADENNFRRFNSLDQVIKDTSNTTKWTRVGIDFNTVPADEIHAQNPGRGGGGRRRRHTRRKRRSGQGLKSRRHHSFRNPR